jgi:hypothetical protein
MNGLAQICFSFRTFALVLNMSLDDLWEMDEPAMEGLLCTFL